MLGRTGNIIFKARLVDSRRQVGFNTYSIYRFKPLEKIPQVKGGKVKKSAAMVNIPSFTLPTGFDRVVLDNALKNVPEERPGFIIDGYWEQHPDYLSYFFKAQSIRVNVEGG